MAPFVSVLTGRAELYFDDHFRFSAPIAGLVAESVRAGHLPLWNPWTQTGTPLLAERGGMVCHPGMLLALFFSPSHAVGILMVLCLGVLAAGSTALLRALSVRPVLAIAAGAAIGLSGPALSYTSAAPFLATLAFWPLVLLSALRLAAGRGSVLVAGASLGMALLGGDLPGALLAALVALVVFRAAGGRLRAAWPRLLAVAGIALVLGAGSWYPVVWALPLSDRGAGIAAAEAGRWSFHPGELVGFLWPHPLGLPLPRFTLWPFLYLHTERLFLHSVWIGALLASASVLNLRRRADPAARAFVIVALVLLIVATGATTPLWPLWRPIFTFVRYPSKMAAPAALLLALAGAVSLDGLIARPRAIRNLGLVVAGLALLGTVLGPFLLATLARRTAAPEEIIAAAAGGLRTGTLRVAGFAAIAAMVFFLVERRRLSAVHAVPLLAALVFLDVFVATADLAWTRPAVAVTAPPYLPQLGVRGPRVMRLQEISQARLGLSDDAFSQEQLRQAALLAPLANLTLHAGVLDPYGFYLADVSQAMAELAKSAPAVLAEVTAADLVLASPREAAPWLAQAVDSRRLRPTHALAAGALVLRVEQHLPRSYLATAASLVPRSEIPRGLAHDHDRVLLTAKKALWAGSVTAPPPVPPEILTAPAQPPTALAPIAWRPGAATYRTNLAVSSLLVEVDAFVPGWRVLVDGKEHPIFQANVFGRAVVVPAGDHTIVWSFSPPLLVASLVASWVAAIALLVMLVLRRIRSRA
jgi:hypothetical protein